MLDTIIMSLFKEPTVIISLEKFFSDLPGRYVLLYFFPKAIKMNLNLIIQENENKL